MQNLNQNHIQFASTSTSGSISIIISETLLGPAIRTITYSPTGSLSNIPEDFARLFVGTEVTARVVTPFSFSNPRSVNLMPQAGYFIRVSANTVPDTTLTTRAHYIVQPGVRYAIACLPSNTATIQFGTYIAPGTLSLYRLADGTEASYASVSPPAIRGLEVVAIEDNLIIDVGSVQANFSCTLIHN